MLFAHITPTSLDLDELMIMKMKTKDDMGGVGDGQRGGKVVWGLMGRGKGRVE